VIISLLLLNQPSHDIKVQNIVLTEEILIEFSYFRINIMGLNIKCTEGICHILNVLHEIFPVSLFS